MAGPTEFDVDPVGVLERARAEKIDARLDVSNSIGRWRADQSDENRVELIDALEACIETTDAIVGMELRIAQRVEPPLPPEMMRLLLAQHDRSVEESRPMKSMLQELRALGS